MALSCKTPVPTPGGWLDLTDITPGQEVFDQTGQICNVVAVCQRDPEPVYEVAFDDGCTLLAGANHPWVTMSHLYRHRAHKGKFLPGDWASNFSTLTTGEVQDTLVFRSGTLVESRHSVPVALPLKLPRADLAIDPYLMGLWLGDGTSTAPDITCQRDDEPHYRQKAVAACENWRIRSERKGVLTCTLSRGPAPLFKIRLRELGLLGNKHIPGKYLRAGFYQRLQLLQGLVDSDGYLNPVGGAIEFTSTREQLAKGALELALSLGQKATLNKGDASMNGRWISKKWRVCFAPSIMAASLPRKADLVKEFVDKMRRVVLPRRAQRYIRSVELAGEHPTTCILVDSHSRMLLVGEHMIPVRASGLPCVTLPSTSRALAHSIAQRTVRNPASF